MTSDMFQQYGLIASSGLLALSVATVSWVVGRMMVQPRTDRPDAGMFERQRRQQLRAGNTLYRWFEPLIDELAGLLQYFGTDSRRELEHHLQLSNTSLPWQPAEFIATRFVEGLLAAAALFLVIALTGHTLVAAVLATLVLLTYPTLARNSVVSRSRGRQKRIRLRLPFAVDQIALMMTAGAGLEESLLTVAHQNARHPLGEELSDVLQQITMGRPRGQALHAWRNRLADDDVSELVFAINKGEELGTPLSAILREQANQMRLKRSQWAEKAASEAEVQMVFPGMLVMVACLLVIVAPILLPALLSFLE